MERVSLFREMPRDMRMGSITVWDFPLDSFFSNLVIKQPSKRTKREMPKTRRRKRIWRTVLLLKTQPNIIKMVRRKWRITTG